MRLIFAVSIFNYYFFPLSFFLRVLRVHACAYAFHRASFIVCIKLHAHSNLTEKVTNTQNQFAIEALFFVITQINCYTRKLDFKIEQSNIMIYYIII